MAKVGMCRNGTARGEYQQTGTARGRRVWIIRNALQKIWEYLLYMLLAKQNNKKMGIGHN
jgi:hypothetical protein